MKITTSILFAIACSLSLMGTGAHAQNQGGAAPTTTAPSGSAAAPSDQASAMTDGEVRKLDRDAKKMTIKHGEIANLGMPAMTMVFQVRDPALLDKVKPGDKVRFHAEKQGGAIVITAIEQAQ